MKTLQVREVPEAIHLTLKLRAMAAGQSLSEYVLAELTRSASTPTLAEVAERVRLRGRVEPATSARDALVESREQRTA